MLFKRSTESPIPFPSHFVQVAGFRMHYIDEGAGDDSRPVVMLLHGNPTWCFYYRNLITQLKDRFRVIAPDFIGCGLSDHPSKAHFRASDRIAHLEEFVAKLGLKKFSIVMHDWGGPIGTGYVVRHADTIERLVYLNTTLTETEALPRIIKTAAHPLIGKFLTKYTKRFLKLTTEFGVHKRLPRDVQKGYLFPYRSIRRRTAIWDFVADIPFDSSHPSYAEMLGLAEKIPALSHIPVQIVWGLKDPCFHREMLTTVARQFPHARILEIGEASHLVLEDAPDIAGKVIKEFLVEGREGLPLTAKAVEATIPNVNALYNSFMRVAAEMPGNDAVISPTFLGDTVRYLHVKYRDLSALVAKYQRGLSELGLKRGDKVLMLVSPGVDFLALSYAVMGRGALPFFLDPGMGKGNLISCIQEIRPDVFIGSPKAQIFRFLNKKVFSGIRFHVTASEWVYLGGPHLGFLKKFAPIPLPDVSGDGSVLVAYTSGATGRPKGVLLTDEMINAQLKIFAEVFGMQRGRKDLPLLPIFSLFTCAIGVCSVFPPINTARPLSLEPWKVLKILVDLDIDYSFGSPTLWNKIGEYCVRSRARLSSLKKIFIAGAEVQVSTLSLLTSLLDGGEIYTPYGSTEALPVTLASGREILSRETLLAEGGEQGIYVGKPVPGVRAKVVEVEERHEGGRMRYLELGQGTIGELIVSGKNVSPSYFENDIATRKAKLVDGETLWHRMGDVGYFDANGNFYYCGRRAHVVRANGKVYYPIPVEHVFNKHKKVRRSALIALNGGEEVGLAIEPYPQFWPESVESKEVFCKELREIASSNALTAEVHKFYFHRSFPVDARHNAKIFRDKLGELASKGGILEKAA